MAEGIRDIKTLYGEGRAMPNERNDLVVVDVRQSPETGQDCLPFTNPSNRTSGSAYAG
jgi:hypothetical protein